MTRYPVLQVDAFTATPLRGNPAAVVLDAAGLTDETMQAIAREMNLSETAFVSAPQTDTADYAARFFTPAKEIPLPGHPIIATAQALADTGRWAPDPGRVLRLETRRGVVPVTHRNDEPGPDDVPASQAFDRLNPNNCRHSGYPCDNRTGRG